MIPFLTDSHESCVLVLCDSWCVLSLHVLAGWSVVGPMVVNVELFSHVGVGGYNQPFSDGERSEDLATTRSAGQILMRMLLNIRN